MSENKLIDFCLRGGEENQSSLEPFQNNILRQKEKKNKEVGIFHFQESLSITTLVSHVILKSG